MTNATGDNKNPLNWSSLDICTRIRIGLWWKKKEKRGRPTYDFERIEAADEGEVLPRGDERVARYKVLGADHPLTNVPFGSLEDLHAHLVETRR